VNGSWTSHATRHTSHVTRHTSHVTRHTSHVTCHTSHVTRHTSRLPHMLLQLHHRFQSWSSLWQHIPEIFCHRLMLKSGTKVRARMPTRIAASIWPGAQRDGLGKHMRCGRRRGGGGGGSTVIRRPVAVPRGHWRFRLLRALWGVKSIERPEAARVKVAIVDAGKT
jgi:hypothetical protein